jgi:hypothetical protein
VVAELLRRQNHQAVGGEEDPVPGIKHKAPLNDTSPENPLAVAPAPPVETIFLEENEADPLQSCLCYQFYVGLAVPAVVPKSAGAVPGSLEAANGPDHPAAKPNFAPFVSHGGG